jgi:hypothetical protein
MTRPGQETRPHLAAESTEVSEVIAEACPGTGRALSKSILEALASHGLVVVSKADLLTPGDVGELLYYADDVALSDGLLAKLRRRESVTRGERLALACARGFNGLEIDVAAQALFDIGRYNTPGGDPLDTWVAVRRDAERLLEAVASVRTATREPG